MQYGLNVSRLILVLEEISFHDKINVNYNLLVYILRFVGRVAQSV